MLRLKLSTYARNAITLGLLAAIGPFAIDMYLPALPTIAADLRASTAATQMTLMAFFVAFGVCLAIHRAKSKKIRVRVFILVSPPCASGSGQKNGRRTGAGRCCRHRGIQQRTDCRVSRV